MSKTNSELIKELRDLTLAGMQDCKNALVEANWDMNAAIDLVKAKGLQNTSRVESKVATEGVIRISPLVAEGLGSCMIMLETNCNTDFCAKSPDFSNFVDDVMQGLGNLVLARGSDVDLNSMASSQSGRTLEDHRKELMAKTKENILVRRWWIQEVVGQHRKVVSYLHSNNKLGVLVWIEALSKNPETLEMPEVKELADNVAMQIAAMNPIAVERSRLTQQDVDRQTAILEVQIKDLNKPEAQIAKILDGKLNKYFSEVCLVDQEAVFAPKQKVGALLDKAGIRVLGFTRAEVGAGVEQKAPENYADEVNKLAGL